MSDMFHGEKPDQAWMPDVPNIGAEAATTQETFPINSTSENRPGGATRRSHFADLDKRTASSKFLDKMGFNAGKEQASEEHKVQGDDALGRTFGVYSSAKAENQETDEFIRKQYPPQLSKISQLAEVNAKVCAAFQDLEEFSGRFLKVIYDYKKEEKEDEQNDIKQAVLEFKDSWKKDLKRIIR